MDESKKQTMTVSENDKICEISCSCGSDIFNMVFNLKKLIKEDGSEFIGLAATRKVTCAACGKIISLES